MNRLMLKARKLAEWIGAAGARPARITAVLVVVTPLVVSLLLVRGLMDSSLADFVPATDDEMYYWHQVATFAETGFYGGYYTFEEHPARFTVSRFGAHGPLFPMLYGGLGNLVGWERHSPVIFNLALATLSLAVLVVVARPTVGQAGILVLLLATFWPLLWEMISSMQEGLHYAVAILISAAAYRLLAHPGNRLRWLAVLFVVAMVAISLLRPFWALLLLPLWILALARQTPRALGLLAAAYGAILAAILLTVTFIASPYPNFIRDLVEVTRTSLPAGAKLFASHFINYSLRLVTFEAANELFDLARIQFLALLLALVVTAVFALRRQRQPSRADVAAGPDRDTLFHLFNMGSILLILLALYIPIGYQGFRIIGPYILMTVLLLVLRRRYALAAVLIATNLLIAPVFATNFVAFKARNFAYDAAAVASFETSIGDRLDHQPGADGWMNTLLLDGKLLCQNIRCDFVAAIPAGRGVSVIFFPDRLEAPLKSQYLLLGDGTLERLHQVLGPDLRLEYLLATPVGDLYLNLDCDCEGAAN